MWAPQFALASGGWHVVAPELRGMNGGAHDPPAVSMDDYAGDLIDLLDALHVDEAVVAGLSMGGYAALAIFRHAARYVRGLVLADTRSPADTPEGIEGRKRMLALLAEKGASGVADEMLPRLVGETTRRERPDVIDDVRRMILDNSANAIAGAIRAMMTRPDSTPLLASIHCPTLILAGAEDVITPPSMAEDLRRGIPGAELVILPRAGHLANLEQPDAFTAALARFLEHRI